MALPHRWDGGVQVVGRWGRMNSVTSQAVVRDPADWIEDMTWHRRMFRHSKFRWVPEDPIAIALTWTRGQLIYDTPGTCASSTSRSSRCATTQPASTTP